MNGLFVANVIVLTPTLLIFFLFFQIRYGFGTQWLTKTNITRTAPQNELPSPVESMSRKEAEENYAVGPPYIATAYDFYKIVTKWKDFVPKVHDDYP